MSHPSFRPSWRAVAVLVSCATLLTGLVLGVGVPIAAGFLGLLAVAFHFALGELGALDAPPDPPGLLESGPDILSVDLRDRDRD